MTESIRTEYLIPATPASFPGLVAFWKFDHSASKFTANEGEAYRLRSEHGPFSVVEDPQAPFGGKAIQFNEGQFLNSPRAECPLLDIHGKDGQLTVIAWIKREQKSNRECEFIAGQWNESQGGRQYGLFLNIGVWHQADQVTGHLSNVGGPTPGYKYCVDGPVGSTPVGREAWSIIGMSYDAQSGYAWLNGLLDSRPGLNPYSMAGGLNNGGSNGSDFTVGAVHRGGCFGNFFVGKMAGLAVYNRALTPGEMFALAQQ